MVMPFYFSTTAISLTRVSGGTVFFKGFRDSIVFILLIVLYSLMNAPVLLRSGIFQVTLDTTLGAHTDRKSVVRTQ